MSVPLRTMLSLWIALKFFVLLQSKQPWGGKWNFTIGCELLSNFLYFCSRNNKFWTGYCLSAVVNCSQIFCTFAVETTHEYCHKGGLSCELLSNFLYFCSRNNRLRLLYLLSGVVNCSQIFCTFAVETTDVRHCTRECRVVNCSQIFCTFAVETTYHGFSVHIGQLWIALKFFVLLQSKQQEKSGIGYTSRCELLSNFLYFCSRNNRWRQRPARGRVVNCSQIFCTFAVETTAYWFW